MHRHQIRLGRDFAYQDPSFIGMLGVRTKIFVEVFEYFVPFRFFFKNNFGFPDHQSCKARTLSLQINARVIVLSKLHTGLFDELFQHH